MMYTVLPSGAVQRSTDGAVIPADKHNRDYQEYLAWREAGNTPLVKLNLSTVDNAFGDDTWQF